MGIIGQMNGLKKNNMKPEIFTFEGGDYVILCEHKGSTERGHYEIKITDVTRERDVFAWRPWWVGNKFRWLKKIRIVERLTFTRSTSFDDGWSYQEYWENWKKEWEAEKIL